jgi:hypothetical protein
MTGTINVLRQVPVPTPPSRVYLPIIFGNARGP